MSSTGKPLLSANWFRVAAVRPRLRDHVRITRQHYRGERWFVLEDLVENRVHRYAPAAQQAIGMMDGTHTLDEIWTALATLGEERPTQDEMIHLLAQLDGANLLATERVPDLAELSIRARRAASGKLWRRLANPLYLRIPLCDPDKFLDATVGLVRPFWSVWGFVLWLGVVGWAASEAMLHWNELTQDLADRVLARDNILILAVTFPVLKLLHELGHCYAAKLGGAAVHEAGVMTLVVMPVPYVDVTGASAFHNKWRRALVGAAGMLTELFCAGLAMMVWVNAEPGLARAAAFNCLLIAGVSTLLFNGNPLLRFDAYFILSDLIEIPNRHTSDPFLRLSAEPLRLRRTGTNIARAGARRDGMVYLLRPRFLCVSTVGDVVDRAVRRGAVARRGSGAGGVDRRLGDWLSDRTRHLADRARSGAASAPDARRAGQRWCRCGRLAAAVRRDTALWDRDRRCGLAVVRS